MYASFDKYVEVERLEGDNKYHAEQYGLQVRCLWTFMHVDCILESEGNMFILYSSLTLSINLSRFSYNFFKPKMVKPFAYQDNKKTTCTLTKENHK